MPLPLILAGIAIAAGGYGVKKGVDARSDFNQAKSVNKDAFDLFDNAEISLRTSRENAQANIEKLGTLKFGLYENALIPFVDTFSKIKHIDFDDSNLQNHGTLSGFNSDELSAMKTITLQMKEVISGGIGSLGAGGLAGLATYGGVGLLGTASTGAGIAGLSGVAATNATLAWLGGGSLAAGGMGMAGGMAVLGGIVAGPVLAIGGMMLASKAEAAKSDAYANLAEAKLASEKMSAAQVATDGIAKRFSEITQVLSKLEKLFMPKLDEMSALVFWNQDYRTYTEQDKQSVFQACALAKAIKLIMEAPILNKDGVLTSMSRGAVEAGKRVANEFS